MFASIIINGDEPLESPPDWESFLLPFQPEKKRNEAKKYQRHSFSPASPTPFAAMWPRQDMVDYAYKYANQPPHVSANR